MKLMAMEMIQYQNNDPVVSKLTACIESIIHELHELIDISKTGKKGYEESKLNKKLIQNSIHVKELENILQERFRININIQPQLSEIFPAAIIPFFGERKNDLDLNLSLFTNLLKIFKTIEKDREKVLKDLHNKKGFIDFKHAYVGGYLSEFKHYLMVNFYYFFCLKLSASEIAAVILHEVGHAFHGLSYHYRLDTTNSTIADIINELNENNPDKAVYIYKTKFSAKDTKDLDLGTNEERYDFYNKLIHTYIGEINSQLSRAKYDETNFENLADSFATRFGLGEELVTGLNKIYKFHKATTDSYNYAALFFDIMCNLLMLLCLGPIGVIVALSCIYVFCHSGHTIKTYDNASDRYNRIRNGIINNLKNDELPEGVVKHLLKQIETIDTVMKNSFEYQGLWSKVADMILPTNRQDNKEIAVQQQIENMLNNSLFISGSKLKIS